MRPTTLISIAAIAVGTTLAGCAGDPTTDLLTTASIAKPAPSQAHPYEPAFDPACPGLKSKITSIRAEGTPGRVHKVATGKTKIVRIKRASIAKVAELDRLNAEFQAKCSKLPAQKTASKAAPKSAALSADAAAKTIAQAKAAAGAAQQARKVLNPTQPIVAVPRR